jgi:hypothetical protein
MTIETISMDESFAPESQSADEPQIPEAEADAQEQLFLPKVPRRLIAERAEAARQQRLMQEPRYSD